MSRNTHHCLLSTMPPPLLPLLPPPLCLLPQSRTRSCPSCSTSVRTLTQPCLVAWARDDRLVAPHIIEGLVEVVPEGPRLCFETGGHNLQKTQATEIAEALRCWMPGLSSPAPTP